MSYDYLIHNHYGELTKSERKVADFIRQEGPQIVYATMTDIKTATHVGDATIIRFCQKLGFSGFSDFKIAIAKEDYTAQEETEPQDDYDLLARRLSTVLLATAKLTNRNALNQAITQMTTAQHIYLFGVGGSGEVASSFASLLLRVGVQATAVTDPHFQAQVASILTTGDLVFGFSLSGRTKDTYDALKIAKANGADIVAVTNYDNTPIGQLSNVVLQTAVEEFFDGGSVAGRISQLYVCDILTKGYEVQNKVNVVSLREKVIRSIVDKSIE
mgnify:CR=1 FL=1